MYYLLSKELVDVALQVTFGDNLDPGQGGGGEAFTAEGVYMRHLPPAYPFSLLVVAWSITHASHCAL